MPLATRQFGSMDNARNLNPHAEAVAAMHLWGYEYGHQFLGCMDWWDGLSDDRKTIVREMLDRCATLPREAR